MKAPSSTGFVAAAVQKVAQSQKGKPWEDSAARVGGGARWEDASLSRGQSRDDPRLSPLTVASRRPS